MRNGAVALGRGGAVITAAVMGWMLVASASAQSPSPEAGAEAARALLAPKHEATLASEITARIDRMPLDSGQRFRNGDVLVAFDCATYRAAHAEARAILRGAQTSLENARRLTALQSGSALATALAEAELEKARAGVEVAAIPVERCVLKAPFAGVVVARLARPHESVTAGQQLLTILDDSNLEVQVVVPSAWLRWIQPGIAFALHVDETDRRYEAVVDRVGARVDPVSQTVEVFGRLTSRPAELVVGMSGSALFRPGPPPASR